MSTINIGTSINTGFKVESDTTGALLIKTGAGLTTALTISSGQNIGFGTTPNASWYSTMSALQIGAGISLWAYQPAYNIFDEGVLSVNAYNDGSYKYIGAGYASQYVMATGVHYWKTAASGSANGALTFITRMTLDNSGNLGIGVTDPATYGGIAVARPVSDANFAVRSLVGIGGAGTGIGLDSLLNGAAGLSKFGFRGSDFIWRTTVDAMTLSASGGLTIAAQLYIPAMATGGSANVHWSSGNGQLFYVTSALKYKHDVRDIEDIDPNLLRPVRYKSNNVEVDGEGDHFGFIADEAHAAGVTELVTYRNGEVDGFRYDRVTPLLWKMAQQQKAEIDALKAEVALLKGNQ